jgi:SAM-dependent methyltransferase
VGDSVAVGGDYDILAPAYDLLTAEHAHAAWLDAIERLAREHGLRGRRVLDVACGTGKSFAPLVSRGYAVTACDGSPAMAARARVRAGGAARVHVADMRALPVLGEFDLVTCLDDAVNHLPVHADVLAALRGMRANLARGGVLAFDVSLLAAYAGATDLVVDDERHVVCWRGARVRGTPSGGTAEIAVELFSAAPGGLWSRRTLRQRHRHYPLAELRALAREAGLRVLAVRGQRAGGVIEPRVDESSDRKALLLLARA